ncbi:MAG: response regulator [Akkermansiaceae bacterium]|jgi:FixJ family two-component response regulator|nr:response regulator [Akkermansiaceae bacterium]
MTIEDRFVYLVDDDDSLRTAIKRMLDASGFKVCAYPSVAEFLMRRDRSHRGCLILDVRMPGGPSGLELQKALADQGDNLPIIFLTGHGDIPMSVQVMKAGASDFLTKPVESDVLIDAINTALDKEASVHRISRRRRELAESVARLTPAELRVFQKIVEGHTNKKVADDLGCSERTVKAHRAKVMTKMGAASLAELVQFSGYLSRKPNQ